MGHEYHVGSRENHSVTQAASDHLQQHLAGVRYQRDTPVVTAFCPVPLFVGHLGSGNFLC